MPSSLVSPLRFTSRDSRARRQRRTGSLKLHRRIAYAGMWWLILISVSPTPAQESSGNTTQILTSTATNTSGSISPPGPDLVDRLSKLLFGRNRRRSYRNKKTVYQSGPQVRVGPANLEGYVWNFSRANDTDQDNEPDGWVRRKGRGYPNYIGIEIVPHDPELDERMRQLDRWLLSKPQTLRTWQWVRRYVPWMMLMPPQPDSVTSVMRRMAIHPLLHPLPPALPDFVVNRFLKITLDGGLAEYQSSLVPTNRAFQYRFQCRVMTNGLRHDTAVAELVFLDDDQNELVAHGIQPVGGTTPWKQVQIDRIRPPVDATQMKVRLRVQGGSDGLRDIRGEIGFDDIEIEQFPQLRIMTDQPRGLYWQDQTINIVSRLMGLKPGDYKIRFRLIDHEGTEIATAAIPVDQSIPTDRFAEASVAFAKQIAASPEMEDHEDELITIHSADDLIVRWDPPRLQPGFYRIVSALEDGRNQSLATETTIAVVDRLIEGPPHGPFGWTLPDQRVKDFVDLQWSTDDLVQWLRTIGVSWVKYPCWLDPTDEAGAEKLTILFRKLQDSGIQVVGMLDVPPEPRQLLYDLRGDDDLVAAQLFRDPNVWRRELESVMTNLTLRCRVWQLGADRDYSFLGRLKLRESIKQISTGLQGFGQPIDVALSWPWMERELPQDSTTWQAVCRSGSPALNSAELDEALRLSVSESGLGPRSWMLLDPVHKQEYPREERIKDLVHRMVTVRKHRVEASFVSEPRNENHGLLRPDGRPDELLLPWRTTVRLIGNLRHEGSVALRSKANNVVLAGSGRAVMIVWSAEPTEELMYLGDNARQVDVWGKSTPLPRENAYGHPVHRISIGPMPTFLVNIDPTLIAFRMSVELRPKVLDSLLGKRQRVSVAFTNPTNISLIGSINLRSPSSWRVGNSVRSWELLASKSDEQAFDVILANNATVGDYEIPIGFEFQTTPPRQITVHRHVMVGPEDVIIKTSTRMIGDDMLVQMEMTNSGPRRVSYRCNLFPRNGRQDERLNVSVPAGATVKRMFSLKNGEELVGQTMWLRIVEIDAERILNYPIVGQR